MATRKTRSRRGANAAAASKRAPGPEGIGARLRFLRRQRDMTLERLAAASRLTKSFVSKIERGLTVPSISTAMRLAAPFGMTVSQLLGEQQHGDAVALVRKHERRSFMRLGSASGYNYEMLAGPKRFRRMEPYVMRPPLKFQDDRRFEHVGEELMFVLVGRVEVEVAGRRYRLNAGDALYFDSHLAHRTRALVENAQVLVVIVGP